jgi:DNA polymerase elongation subunit (family B)
VAQINAAIPTGIRLGFDGRYRTMLSYKTKNYALLAYDGTLRSKGSSLVSRAIEPFGRQFVVEAIPLLLAHDIQGLHALYLRTRERIVRHDWTVEDFARTETLKSSVERYQADVASGRRTKAAAYELAIARAAHTGRPVQRGDRIRYYVTGTNPTVTTFDNARLADVWNAVHADENTAYYLKRLDEFARKFTPFFSPADFARLFAPDDLFGFTPDDITLLTTERS